ncbi:hypothetical protein B5M09_002048 [Aphanomyces astaci]|uniref:Uncharacterized protein n=1 Tax=Aphanomyces astaci TaxID=112090 RepID=A0A425DBH4_APHAT|nr:hypothetical protein B5M09_002048 [Aphanomyces astaci]
MLRFQDCHAGSCTFRSKASVKKATSNASTDAVQVEFESASTQTAVAVDNGSQTEYISRDCSTTHPPDEVSSAVQAFLNSAGNRMLREMKHSNQSSAFLDFEPEQDADDKHVSKVFTLTFDFFTHFKQPIDELKWSTNAQRLVGASPQSADVRRHVEAHAKDKKLREIRVASVFDAKPDVGALYRSALDFAFEPHGGPVYDIQYSPFHPSLFLTASSDGTVRLYNYLQKAPVVAFEVGTHYLYSVAWSKTRPLVFSVASEDGNIYVFDLKLHPVVTLAVDSKQHRAAVYTLDFNPRQRNFLACGDSHGLAHVWKLNWQLSNVHPTELGLLNDLADRRAL